jgi:hypothetical protein
LPDEIQQRVDRGYQMLLQDPRHPRGSPQSTGTAHQPLGWALRTSTRAMALPCSSEHASGQATGYQEGDRGRLRNGSALPEMVMACEKP